MTRHFPVTALLLALAATGCGRQTNDPAFSRVVATNVKRDCLSGRSQAPNAAFAHHVERLCDCSYEKIAATPLLGPDNGAVDRDEAVNQKVQAALQACVKLVGGAPDAEDYRTAGMQPPSNSADR